MVNSGEQTPQRIGVPEQTNTKGGTMTKRNLIYIVALAAVTGLAGHRIAFALFGGDAVLTPDQMSQAINECYGQGSSPKPVYDDRDPMRVFAVKCQK